MTTGYQLESTVATAVVCAIGHCWVRKVMIGICLPSFRVRHLWIEYFPAIYTAAFIADKNGAGTTAVPNLILPASSHQASSGLSGAEKLEMSDARRADGGRWTWSKLVIEKSRGLVPLRGGRRIEVTPRYISCSLQMGTIKNLHPRSSMSTISLAMTSATFGIPNAGVEAGINLQSKVLNRYLRNVATSRTLQPLPWVCEE